MTKGKNVKVKNKEDMYYDGFLDDKYEDFCEETQRVVKNVIGDGWDRYEDLEEDVEWEDE